MPVSRHTRFLNNNFMSPDLISASSRATGTITALRRTDAVGYANLAVTGAFSGSEDLDYYIEIETGGEVGVATFKWSTDDGDTFVATGQVTSAAEVALNNGMIIRWMTGIGGVDFTAGDIWRWRAYLPYGPSRMTDRDRDTEFRSGSTSAMTVTADFAAAVVPTVFVLFDHNLRAVGGSLRLQGSSNNFASIGADYVIPVREGAPIVHYLTDGASFRYWRIGVSDPGNPDGYLRWSETYLGTYYQTPRKLELGDVLARMRVVGRDRSIPGRWINTVPKINRTLDATFDFLPEDDREELFAAFEQLFNQTLYRTGPVFLHPDSADPDTLLLAQWPDMAASRSMPASPERYTMSFKFYEVPRTI